MYTGNTYSTHHIYNVYNMYIYYIYMYTMYTNAYRQNIIASSRPSCSMLQRPRETYYIFIYRERKRDREIERERQREAYIHIVYLIYIYILHIYIIYYIILCLGIYRETHWHGGDRLHHIAAIDNTTWNMFVTWLHTNGIANQFYSAV